MGNHLGPQHGDDDFSFRWDVYLCHPPRKSLAKDLLIIADIVKSMAQQLNASLSMSLSMGSAVLLTSAISQPIFAELAHVIGRRPAYLASMVFFMTGSIVSSFANSSVMLLVGRAIQGIGSGGPQAMSGLVMADLYSVRKRSGAMAYQQASWALGTVAGPLVGGAIVRGKDSAWVCDP
jgi:MFS family permease